MAGTEPSFSNEAKHKITDDKCRIINCARRSLFIVKLCIYALWRGIFRWKLALGSPWKSSCREGTKDRMLLCEWDVGITGGSNHSENKAGTIQSVLCLFFFFKKKGKKEEVRRLTDKIQYRLGHSITHLKTV